MQPLSQPAQGQRAVQPAGSRPGWRAGWRSDRRWPERWRRSWRRRGPPGGAPRTRSPPPRPRTARSPCLDGAEPLLVMYTHLDRRCQPKDLRFAVLSPGVGCVITASSRWAAACCPPLSARRRVATSAASASRPRSSGRTNRSYRSSRSASPASGTYRRTKRVDFSKRSARVRGLNLRGRRMTSPRDARPARLSPSPGPPSGTASS